MNNVIDNIKTRRSVRKYKPDMIDRRLIESVMDAGLYAACGMGVQNTKIIAITEKALKDEISDLNRRIGGWKEGMDPFYGAPIILLVIAKKDRPQRVYDGSLVLGNMMLAAHSLGLGTCWIHRAKEEMETDFGRKLLDRLGIEGEWEGIGHLALGEVDGNYPKTAPRDKDRTYFIERDR